MGGGGGVIRRDWGGMYGYSERCMGDMGMGWYEFDLFHSVGFLNAG